MNVFQRRLIDVAQIQGSVRDTILKNKTRQGQKVLGVEAFSYTANFTALAGGASTTINTNTQGDSDFLIMYLTASLFNNATQANIGSPYARVSVTDNASQRPLNYAPQYVASLFGTAQTPYILQDPRLIPASAQIQTTVYNDSTVGPVVLDGQFSYAGYKVYYA